MNEDCQKVVTGIFILTSRPVLLRFCDAQSARFSHQPLYIDRSFDGVKAFVAKPYRQHAATLRFFNVPAGNNRSSFLLIRQRSLNFVHVTSSYPSHFKYALDFGKPQH
jgi:hypothetical protein